MSKPPTKRFTIGSEWSSPPELYHAIGLLVTQWSQLEAICKMTINHLLDAELKAANIVVSALNSRTVLDVLRKLIHYKDDPARAKKFDRVLFPRMQRALDYRNDFAHAHFDFYRSAELGLSNVSISKTRLRKSGLEIGRRFRATPHQIRRRAQYVSLITLVFLEFTDPYFSLSKRPQK